MSFIPEEEMKGRAGINLAPMIDFLFLMLVFFASLAVSRNTTRDTEIDLVETGPATAPALTPNDYDKQVVTINVSAAGGYKWTTEFRDYPMGSPEEVRDELLGQYEKGILPEDKAKTHVMVKIDKEAQWEPILKLLFAVKEAGFEVHPLYQPEDVADAGL